MKKRLSILMVEDEVLTAMCLVQELKDFGYIVCQCVTSGEAAIKSAREKNPDLILMDIHLAGKLDGIDTLREIQKSKSIPAIFMTGYSNEDIKQRVKQLNSIGYIVKPITAADIKKIIDQNFHPG